MVDETYIRLINASQKKYNVSLKGLNVLVPFINDAPFLLAEIVKKAGAEKIYVYCIDLQTLNSAKAYVKDTDVILITELSSEVLSIIDIIFYYPIMPALDRKKIEFLSKDCFITFINTNFDFMAFDNIKNYIDFDACNEKKIPVISLNYDYFKDKFYEYFTHSVIKKMYKLEHDIFQSKIMLIGRGEVFNSLLKLLKYLGAVVYTYNIDLNTDASYIKKHLSEMDFIIVADYPNSGKQLIGSKGIINVADLVDICPDVNVIHFSGCIEQASLTLGNIECEPVLISNENISLNISKVGKKTLVDIFSLYLLAAENFTKFVNNSMQLDNSIVIYNLLNQVKR